MSMRRVLTLALCASLLGALACNTSGSGKGNGQRRAVPDEPWRQARPPSGPAPALKLPIVQRVELRNGLAVFVVEDHSLPFVAARLVVRAGSAQESAKDAGLAQLTWDLLDEGAGTLNQLALANAFAQLGAQLSTTCDIESGAAHVEVLKKNAEAGLKLLATVVTRPTFGAPDFERARNHAVAHVQERQADPTLVADSLALALVYGSEHPYGHDGAGAADTLGKLSALKAKAFWSTWAVPKNAALILAGDLTVDEAKALAQKTFGAWSGSPRAPKAAAEPTARTAITVAMVDVPGAPQTSIRVARAGVAVSDADLPAMIVLNAIYAGTFSSRLNLKLREEKHWTYGAWSTQVERLGRGPWLTRSEVQTDASADAVAETLAILEGLKAGVTDDEVTRAKEGFARALPGWLGTPSDQTKAIDAAFAMGFGADRYAKLAEAVQAVTVDDVKRVAERVIVKDDLVVVLVGDRATVLPKLKEKGLPEALLFGKDGFPE